MLPLPAEHLHMLIYAMCLGQVTVSLQRHWTSLLGHCAPLLLPYCNSIAGCPIVHVRLLHHKQRMTQFDLVTSALMLSFLFSDLGWA